MTSEIRTNSLKSRAGLSTVTLTDSGPMFSGITTFVDNSTFSVGTGGTIHAPATNTLNIGVNNTESLRIDSNSNLKVAGIVTATHFYGDGSNLSGIQVGGASSLSFNDSVGAYFGNSQDLKIHHDSSHSYIHNTGGNLILRSNYLTLRNEANDQVSYYHENNGTTMLYYAGSTKIRTTSTGIRVTDDISIGDKIVHEGDTNTAIRFPAADTVTVETGGTERLRITSGGSVGINEATPLARLHVKNGESNAAGYAHDTIVVEDSDHAFLTFLTGTSGSSGINFGDAGDPQRGVIQYDQTNDYMRFITAAGERARIDSTGRVLIGTTSADSVGSIDQNVVIGSTTNAEEVALTLNVMEGTNNRRVKFFLDDNDGVFGIDSTASTGVPPFVVRMATGEKLRIATDGKVLIGNGGSYNAGAPLHIHGGVTGIQQLRVQNHTSIGSFTGQYGSEFRHATSSSAHAMLIHCHENNPARRTLDISDQGYGVFASFVNGKLGIQETSPTHELDLGGVATTQDDGSEYTLRIRSNNGKTAIRIGSGGGGSRVALMRFDGDSNPGSGVGCSGDTNASAYGGTLVYHGDRSGNENSFAIYMDQNANASQIEAFNIRQNGDYMHGGSSYSDRDQKENITAISGTALDKITQLSPKTWNWKPEYHDIPTDRIFAGFIAQEVQPHIPSIVTGTDGQGDMALDYQGLLAWTIKAVTELNTKVETLEQENIALRARVTNLEGN